MKSSLIWFWIQHGNQPLGSYHLSTFDVVSKKLRKPRTGRYTPMLSSRGVIVLALTFRSWNAFFFIIIYFLLEG